MLTYQICIIYLIVLHIDINNIKRIIKGYHLPNKFLATREKFFVLHRSSFTDEFYYSIKFIGKFKYETNFHHYFAFNSTCLGMKRNRI